MNNVLTKRRCRTQKNKKRKSNLYQQTTTIAHTTQVKLPYTVKLI